MLVNFSPLKIESFHIEQFHFEFIPPQNESDLITVNSRVEIDYQQYLDEKIFSVQMDIAINQNKSETGYSIISNAIGRFSLDEERLISETDKHNLYGISTLNIMIGHLRGFIRDMTASGFLGAYILPSIDVRDLIERKTKSR